MASEDTLIGNDFVLQLGSTDSPQDFDDFCAVTEVSGIGETKPEIIVTSLCDSAVTRRGGLPDGTEVTITGNFIQGDEQLEALKTSFDNSEVRDFRLLIKDSSPEEYFEFSGAILSWVVTPTNGDRATMTFTVRISGGVTWQHAA